LKPDEIILRLEAVKKVLAGAFDNGSIDIDRIIVELETIKAGVAGMTGPGRDTAAEKNATVNFEEYR